MAAPVLITGAYDPGIQNADLNEARKRLKKMRAYEDQSTIILIPTRGMINARTVECLCNLATPMNQRAMRIFISGAEVGDAYEQAIDMILGHPDLSTWRYILTIEDDLLFPPDLLIRLLESIGEFDAIGALYWTKGEMGQPMIYGDPAEIPVNFKPLMPQLDTIQECNGIAMGASLYKLSSIAAVEKPRFKTVRTATEAWTQDLHMAFRGKQIGHRYAVNTAIKCGHVDLSVDPPVVW